MSRQILRLVDELVAQMESGSDQYQSVMEQLADATQTEEPDGLTAVVEALAPLLPGLAGDFAITAVLAGSCVERGASPMALVDVLPPRAAEALMLNAALPELWDKSTGGRPLPAPSSASADVLIRGLAPRASWWRRRPDGARTEALTRIAMSWFDMDYWLGAMTAVMVDARFRAAVPNDLKTQLREHALAVASRSQEAAWCAVLAAVLDAEELIVVDARSRRVYSLFAGGVGDMGQLYILLADRLIGDPGKGLVAGDRPDGRWVDAATDGPAILDADGPAVPAFRIIDSQGSNLEPESVPADIALLNGKRVLILHPSIDDVVLNVGRMFDRMKPTLYLDRILGPAEAESWLELLTPAAMSGRAGSC
ncbi:MULTISPECIES: hypothetical protein [unclassified Streptomyces]|uniref:hypothetical protein n=1 Tax=unclassified Streptomyces TaxID=2593676 RepID=UPI0033C069D7